MNKTMKEPFTTAFADLDDGEFFEYEGDKELDRILKAAKTHTSEERIAPGIMLTHNEARFQFMLLTITAKHKGYPPKGQYFTLQNGEESFFPILKASFKHNWIHEEHDNYQELLSENHGAVEQIYEVNTTGKPFTQWAVKFILKDGKPKLQFIQKMAKTHMPLKKLAPFPRPLLKKKYHIDVLQKPILKGGDLNA